MVNQANHFWNRLNFQEKICLYRLVNDVVPCPKEKFLNAWWSQLSIYKRNQIFSDLADLANYERKYVNDIETVHESDPFLTSI